MCKAEKWDAGVVYNEEGTVYAEVTLEFSRF
jgi:hypothetical protein